MKKTKTKCYLYTRVSTSMQVDGYSLDAQRDKLRKYAEYEDSGWWIFWWRLFRQEYSGQARISADAARHSGLQRRCGICAGVQAVPVWQECRWRSEFLAADAGFRCQSDLCGRRHWQFQRFRQADDFCPFCGGRDRAWKYSDTDDGRTGAESPWRKMERWLCPLWIPPWKRRTVDCWGWSGRDPHHLWPLYSHQRWCQWRGKISEPAGLCEEVKAERHHSRFFCQLCEEYHW